MATYSLVRMQAILHTFFIANQTAAAISDPSADQTESQYRCVNGIG